jgi:hypothetical protein
MVRRRRCCPLGPCRQSKALSHLYVDGSILSVAQAAEPGAILSHYVSRRGRSSSQASRRLKSHPQELLGYGAFFGMMSVTLAMLLLSH